MSAIESKLPKLLKLAPKTSLSWEKGSVWTQSKWGSIASSSKRCLWRHRSPSKRKDRLKLRNRTQKDNTTESSEKCWDWWTFITAPLLERTSRREPRPVTVHQELLRIYRTPTVTVPMITAMAFQQWAKKSKRFPNKAWALTSLITSKSRKEWSGISTTLPKRKCCHRSVSSCTRSNNRPCVGGLPNPFIPRTDLTFWITLAKRRWGWSKEKYDLFLCFHTQSLQWNCCGLNWQFSNWILLLARL